MENCSQSRIVFVPMLSFSQGSVGGVEGTGELGCEYEQSAIHYEIVIMKLIPLNIK